MGNEVTDSPQPPGYGPSPLGDRYRRWFGYEVDAHGKALSAFATVPVSNRAHQEYLLALELLHHIAMARRMWLARITGRTPMPDSLFPKGASLEQVKDSVAAMHADWLVYLSDLPESSLAEDLLFRTSDGTRLSAKIEDILTQLHGHSLYHLGQVARLIRSCGGEPARTDFIYWAWRRLD